MQGGRTLEYTVQAKVMEHLGDLPNGDQDENINEMEEVVFSGVDLKESIVFSNTPSLQTWKT